MPPTTSPAAATGESQAGEAADADDAGTPGWVWAIMVLLLLGVAAAAGAVYHRGWSNERALNSLFQGGAQSRSLSIRPGRTAAAVDPDPDSGDGIGIPAYVNPTYGAAGNPVTPVYLVSGGVDENDNPGAGTGGVANPTYQIPMEVVEADPTYDLEVPMEPGSEAGPGYLEVKAVTSQPMYRVLGPSVGSARSVVASPQPYDVRSAPPAAGGAVPQQHTYGQLSPTYGKIAPTKPYSTAPRPPAWTSGSVYQTIDPREQ